MEKYHFLWFFPHRSELARQLLCDSLKTFFSEMPQDLTEQKLRNSTFMPSVNHQIGASLNIIVGCTDLLARGIRVKDRKSHKLLNAIADASNWLERSLRMLLDLSQIEARLSHAQDTHLAEPRANLRLELVCRYVKLIAAELAIRGKKNKVKVLPRPKRDALPAYQLAPIKSRRDVGDVQQT